MGRGVEGVEREKGREREREREEEEEEEEEGGVGERRDWNTVRET